MEQIKIAVEHALMNDEITIETYESLHKAIAKGIDGFTLVPVDGKIIVISLDNHIRTVL